MVNYAIPQRINKNSELKCKVKISVELLEEVREFKHFGSISCKKVNMDGETNESAVQGWKVIGTLGIIMKWKNLTMNGKKKKDYRTA